MVAAQQQVRLLHDARPSFTDLQAVEEYSCSVARPAGQSWHASAHCTLHTAMSDDDATDGDAARLLFTDDWLR